ncbi:MAG: phospho-N-acetylmuramoyl-pentapeptide-transferase, partial [Waterburya sp.]
MSTEKLIDPSGKILLVSLVCILTLGAIAVEYVSSISIEQFGLLLFPLIISALISALLGVVIIPILNRLKTGQIVQEDGPQAHLKKAGTPTMGGIFFVPVAVILSLLWINFGEREIVVTSELIAVCLVTLGYGLIGWI